MRVRRADGRPGCAHEVGKERGRVEGWVSQVMGDGWKREFWFGGSGRKISKRNGCWGWSFEGEIVAPVALVVRPATSRK